MNFSVGIAFVNMSASCSPVSQNCSSISFFSASSRMK
ncbi:hypothetical protein BVRB_4g085080 [Beta vulgaris subsp. vulgaris]|nr:hypothetical protein BVRB_4g085080 [Beta vulgaris subsp. vulgaris]